MSKAPIHPLSLFRERARERVRFSTHKVQRMIQHVSHRHAPPPHPSLSEEGEGAVQPSSRGR